jgi:hypothetical protein
MNVIPRTSPQRLRVISLLPNIVQDKSCFQTMRESSCIFDRAAGPGVGRQGQICQGLFWGCLSCVIVKSGGDVCRDEFQMNVRYQMARRAFHESQEIGVAYAIAVMCICSMIPVRLCYSSVYVLGIRYIIKRLAFRPS